MNASKSFEFWKTVGEPKYVLAPMVAQSDLPFRLLTKRYGVELAYTPMLHSRLFSQCGQYRQTNFTTCPEDSPVIAQFCGDDPDIIVQASKYLEQSVDAIDINFGCPQGIAKRGNYGAFLLSNPDLVEDIVRKTVFNASVPVTCKIRKFSGNDPQCTVNLAKRLEAVGCSVLCVHGRTITEKGQMVGEADWQIIHAIKNNLGIPVIANGGIGSLEDAKNCLNVTRADAVMSAEAILENPALFHNTHVDRDVLVKEYLELAEVYPVPASIIKAHLFRLLYRGLQIHTDLRDTLGKAKTKEECENVAKLLRERRRHLTPDFSLHWYYRYRKPHINLVTTDQESTTISEAFAPAKRIKL